MNINHDSGVITKFIKKRIWNDREIDAGIWQVLIGFWLLVHPFVMKYPTPIHIDFSPFWLTILAVLGIFRFFYKKFDILAPTFALLSSVILFSFSFDIIYDGHWEWLLTPVFLLQGYQGIKSYLRLSLPQSVN